MSTLLERPSVALSEFPANRDIDSFEVGQQLFVPRHWSGDGIVEASLGQVVAVNSYNHSVPGTEPLPGDNPNTGFLKVLTDQRNPIRESYFIGDINNAGIIPVEYAPAIVEDEDLRAEWREGAEWSELDDWDAYAMRLLGAAVDRFRMTYADPLETDTDIEIVATAIRGPERHAHDPHNQMLFGRPIKSRNLFDI
ncbi:MAG: hypothetical protein ACHQT9_00290 [Candidatus Saccharimonadales bacterium]